MTRGETIFMVVVLLAATAWTNTRSYHAGRTAERQSRDAVACTPFAPDTVVVPRYRPSGPVTGAIGRTP